MEKERYVKLTWLYEGGDISDTSAVQKMINRTESKETISRESEQLMRCVMYRLYFVMVNAQYHTQEDGTSVYVLA